MITGTLNRGNENRIEYGRSVVSVDQSTCLIVFPLFPSTLTTIIMYPLNQFTREKCERICKTNSPSKRSIDATKHETMSPNERPSLNQKTRTNQNNISSPFTSSSAAAPLPQATHIRAILPCLQDQGKASKDTSEHNSQSVTSAQVYCHHTCTLIRGSVTTATVSSCGSRCGG